MKHYGLEIPENTSGVVNLTAPTGTAFPAEENAGELFFRTDLNRLYVHGVNVGGSPLDWIDVSAAGITTPPAGSNGEIQYNDNGSFGSSSNLTFDGDVLQLSSTAPILRIKDTNATADEKGWQFETSSSGSLSLVALDDTDIIGNPPSFIEFGRDGTDINFIIYGYDSNNIMNLQPALNYVAFQGEFRIENKQELGSTAGNTLVLFESEHDYGVSVGYLEYILERDDTGTDWETGHFRMQYSTSDGGNMAFVRFNGEDFWNRSNDNGIALGTSGGNEITLASNGQVRFVNTSSLGETAGDTLPLFEYRHRAALNAGYLDFILERDVDGTSWTETGFRMQYSIDSVDMGYIKFNGDGNNYGISFGVRPAGQSPVDVLTIVRDGDVILKGGTGGNLTIEKNTPAITLIDTNSSADRQRWLQRIISDSWILQPITDAGSGGSSKIELTKSSGNIIDDFQIVNSSGVAALNLKAESSTLSLKGSQPYIWLENNAVTANRGTWLIGSVSEVLRIQPTNDARSGSFSRIDITRTDQAIDIIRVANSIGNTKLEIVPEVQQILSYSDLFMMSGWKFYIEGGDHSITANDGGGNFNLRVGHTASGTPTYRDTNAGAIHMQFSHENTEPIVNFRIGQTTGSVAGNAVTFDEYCLQVRGRGSFVGTSGASNLWLNSTGSGVGMHRSTTDTGSNDPFIVVARAGAAPLLVNRQTNDGTLVDFRQAGTSEGSISVSGTTVSYNGGHLSRWSQLEGNGSRISIPRGTVMSTIDEMCEWYYIEETEMVESGQTEGSPPTPIMEEITKRTPVLANHPGAILEQNEQITRAKISDTVNDKTVSGVFQSWDDDDDTNPSDMMIAQSGDFVIRVTGPVNKGDLLTSNGDGTAKVQDDDIVRSYTIAKAMYSFSGAAVDEENLVPCLIMLC